MRFRVDPRPAVMVLMMASAFAYAQTDASTDTGNTTSAAAPTKKQIRQQNHALEKMVRQTLTKTKHLDSSDIVIVARNGNVTLDGSVPDPSQIDVAGKSAASVPGVKHLDNRVTLREAGN
jgi:hyperosmotically inducible periplasmic protein